MRGALEAVLRLCRRQLALAFAVRLSATLTLSLAIVLAVMPVLPQPSLASSLRSAPGPTAEFENAIRGLVYARPFVLSVPYTHSWSRENLEVRSGYVLVLDVAPESVQPRQTQMPVLYVGPRPAEIVNGANDGGRVVVIVPGPIDLENVTIFYGSIELPERIDRRRGEDELSSAIAQGFQLLPEEMVLAALEAGGDVLSAPDIEGVYKSLIGVLEVYSPSETDRIASYRLIP